MLSPVNVDENYTKNVLRDKLKRDLDYIENRSLTRDIGLIVTTFFAIGFKILGRYSRVLEEPEAKPADETAGEKDTAKEQTS